MKLMMYLSFNTKSDDTAVMCVCLKYFFINLSPLQVPKLQILLPTCISFSTCKIPTLKLEKNALTVPPTVGHVGSTFHPSYFGHCCSFQFQHLSQYLSINMNLSTCGLIAPPHLHSKLFLSCFWGMSFFHIFPPGFLLIFVKCTYMYNKNNNMIEQL